MLDNSQIVIPATEKAEMTTHVEALLVLITKYLLPLTPEERKSVLKLSEGQYAFVDKVIEYAGKNPTMLPPGFDLEEARRDLAALHDLLEILRPLTRLVYDLESTVMLTGGDIFEAGLLVLAQTRLNVRNNLTGAQAALNEITEHYPRRGRGRKNLS